MSGVRLMARVKAGWRFFRLRYRGNVENPTPRSPERRLRKARTGIGVGLFLGVISLLLAIGAGGTGSWFLVASTLSLAAFNFGELRRARRDRESPRLPHD
jgi:hypothetical protein